MPVKIVVINKSTNNIAGADVKKREPLCTLVRIQTGAATVENNMEFPQKTKNGTAF